MAWKVGELMNSVSLSESMHAIGQTGKAKLRRAWDWWSGEMLTDGGLLHLKGMTSLKSLALDFCPRVTRDATTRLKAQLGI